MVYNVAEANPGQDCPGFSGIAENGKLIIWQRMAAERRSYVYSGNLYGQISLFRPEP
jgi:hypothetical protein